MDTNQIEDVLNVSAILAPIWTDEAPPVANLIASLIDWADSRGEGVTAVAPEPVAPVADKPKAKRGKATESDDSESRVTPDPSSDEPDF